MLKKPLKKKSTLKKSGKSSGSGSSKAFAGFKKARKENERSAQLREMYSNRLNRLRVDVGETRKVIILDNEPFFMNEHHYQTKPGVWNGFVRCRKEVGVCPACTSLEKEGYYAMYLTVLDLKPFKKRDGTVVKKSRQILCVKSSMIPKYERLFKKYGNLRGVMVALTRDSSKEQSSGGAVEYVKRVSEDDLARYKDLNKVTDYKKAFPMPTEEDMRRIFKTGKAVGSEEFDDSDDEDVEDLNDIDDSDF